ncbi:MAG: anaerobic ribonucleoside-triphosphate reductase activating protein [Sodaliphilus sp.]
MKILKIVSGTSVDGPGLRTSVYFAGCTHHCPGCHNPQSWDFACGEQISVEALLSTLLEDEAPVTLSGGDPLEQPFAELLALLKGLKANGVNVWCYTGYTFEQLLHSEKAPLMEYIDVVVDGPFVMAQRDTSLRFRGSSNQRIIDVGASLAAGTAILTPYQGKV